MSVLIFVEIDNGTIKKTSQEAIAYGAQVAQMLNASTTVLALGQADEAALATAGNFGATKVLHDANDKLTQENSLAYAHVLVQAAQQEGSKVIVLAKSGLGDAVAARAAAKLQASVVSNITDLPEISEGTFKVKRSIYTGKAFATVEVQSEIKVLAIRKNAIEPEPTDELATVEPFSPSLRDSDFVATITQVEKASSNLSLTDADIIVSGGRGMKGPENWGPLEELAKALGAATGCSKPVSDLDWRPHHEHIGQTGIKVAPNLYIACGISGAIQHLAGVNGSKYIVVINKDPEAPFFKAADYGIVGDIFEILPRLTKAVEASR
ncbi:electron transfer flavoprotein subunit alpha/FixB family protein [Rhabdobacter roseus]|uniref:Electron transfer flavoprotein alpha subunit n=1 Tax=Rhabdobacter roseus TaxID=1655419 RepID=A0A840TQE6_9BACT|nr:electron transfer flavoprotein subunit alpha/FixB family protein [Rhabdobacter roseus]MBB5283463.1 electron transfer flavoprotein alpha subunit [Rhabdobacter roseus]